MMGLYKTDKIHFAMSNPDCKYSFGVMFVNSLNERM